MLKIRPYPYRSAQQIVTPVLSISKRIQRHYGISTGDVASLLKSFAVRRFYSHVQGLENLRGRKVLEIGGSDEINMQSFFSNIGADYSNVRLEGNPNHNNRVLVKDFMDVLGVYDLVISLGVFEIGAIDINFETHRAFRKSHSLFERLQKLSSLLAPEGTCVIGTINSPCIFDSKTILSAGFTSLHRESPFYTFMNANNKDVYGKNDRSELLIFYK